jgi:hypothetical protein
LALLVLLLVHLLDHLRLHDLKNKLQMAPLALLVLLLVHLLDCLHLHDLKNKLQMASFALLVLLLVPLGEQIYQLEAHSFPYLAPHTIHLQKMSLDKLRLQEVILVENLIFHWELNGLVFQTVSQKLM